MQIFSITDQALRSDYRGCGRAWAAINDAGEVIALRYMDLGTANRRQMAFADHRTAAREELAALGSVISGMCSCTEFVS